MDPENISKWKYCSVKVFFEKTGFLLMFSTQQVSPPVTQLLSVNHLPVRPMQAASFTA